MMPRLALFALVALVPASVSGAEPRFGSGLVAAALCAQGTTRQVLLPPGSGAPRPPADPCCAKGCHAGASRRRAAARGCC